MRVFFAALVCLTVLAACGQLPGVLPDYTSVEAVLRHSVTVGEQLDVEERALRSDEARKPASRFTPRFQRPLKALKVNSGFGKRRGRPHHGLDLQAHEGTPIYAAEKGIVVFAGFNIDGYGETVILRHVGGYATLYAHTSALRVQVGDRVGKGDCIAYAGQSGHASGPHLHFELRDGTRAVNPGPWIGIAPRKVAGKPVAKTVNQTE
jgi:murein DD-endopeptidase MepM/ murein hydrolase activator NlpD